MATSLLSWGYVWPKVSLTWSSATLGHWMPLMGDMPDQWSGWPNIVPLLPTRYLSYGISDQRSARLEVVPLLATRCNYCGYVWSKVSLTWSSTIHGNKMPLLGGMSEQRSSWPEVIPLLASRCLFQGTSDQRSAWPDIVPFLDTRCPY